MAITWFEKALEQVESPQETIQAFKGIESFFGGSTRLSKECFLVTRKLFELNAFQQVISFAGTALPVFLNPTDDTMRLLTANVLCLMADSYSNLHNFDETLRCFDRAVSILAQISVNKNDTALDFSVSIQNKIFTLNEAMGNMEEKDLVDVLKILEIRKQQPRRFLELVNAYVTVSDTYLRFNNAGSSLLYCMKAFDIYEKHLRRQPMEDSSVSAVCTLAVITDKMLTIQNAIRGNREEADHRLLSILESRRSTLEEDCVDLGNANMLVADTFLVDGRQESALPYVTKALEIYEKHQASLEDNNASAVETLLDIHRKMFTIKDAMGRDHNAVAHLSKIADIRKRMCAEDSVEVGISYMTVAQAYLNNVQQELIFPSYIKAVKIFEKYLVPVDGTVGFTHSTLGAAYLESGQREQIAKFFENAKFMLDLPFGPRTSHMISKVYAALGSYDEAIPIEEKVVEGLQVFLDESLKHLSDMKDRVAISRTKASSSQSTDDAELAAKISEAGLSNEET